MSTPDPCRCHECVVAGCDRPPVIAPGPEGGKPRELHGKDLAGYYRAQDALRATMTKLRGSVIEKALTKVLPEMKS